jgi:peptide/nickel transport system permease protein
MFVKFAWNELRRDPFMLMVAALTLSLLVLSLVVPALAGTDPNRQDLLNRLASPSWHVGHLDFLGTDQLGRPMWIRLLDGLRTSYIVALLAVGLGFVIGVLAGLIAGYAGGWVDDVIMRIAEVQMSLPGLLIAIALLAVLGGGIVPLVIILGLDNWMLYARVTRSVVASLRQSDFVLAIKGLGARPPRTVFGHLLPNSTPALVAIATVELGRVMIAESSLSFLGFGIKPPTVSLGLILAEGRDYLGSQWWVTTLAGALLAVAVLCVSLMGNWLQRVTDPLRIG